jgi:hypothetical protein
MATDIKEATFSETDILRALGRRDGTQALKKLKALHGPPLSPDQYEAVVEFIQGRAGARAAKALAGLHAYIDEHPDLRKQILGWAARGKTTRPGARQNGQGRTQSSTRPKRSSSRPGAARAQQRSVSAAQAAQAKTENTDMPAL